MYTSILFRFSSSIEYVSCAFFFCLSFFLLLLSSNFTIWISFETKWNGMVSTDFSSTVQMDELRFCFNCKQLMDTNWLSLWLEILQIDKTESNCNVCTISPMTVHRLLWWWWLLGRVDQLMFQQKTKRKYVAHVRDQHNDCRIVCGPLERRGPTNACEINNVGGGGILLFIFFYNGNERSVV